MGIANIRDIIYTELDKVFSLQSQIEEYETVGRVSKTIRECLKILKSLAQSIENILLSLYKEGCENKDKVEGLIKQARIIGGDIGYLRSCIRYIEGARFIGSHPGIAIPINLIVKELDPHSLALVRMKWKYNYRYFNFKKEIKKNIETLSPVISKILDSKKNSEQIQVLSYAGLDKENIFLSFEILAHEIGHFIDEMNHFSILNEENKKAIKWDEKILDKIVATRIAVEPRYSSEGLFKGESLIRLIRRDEIRQALHLVPTWLRELVADLISVYIMGPASFFAQFNAQTSLFSSYEIIEDYPPTIVRLHTMFNIINEKYSDFFRKNSIKNNEQICNFILELFEEYEKNFEDAEKEITSHHKEEDKEEKIKLLRVALYSSAIGGLIKNLGQKIQNSISEKHFFKFHQNIFRQIYFLDNFIPPNQIFNVKTPENLNIKSILNAAWIHWLKWQRSSREKKDIKFKEEYNRRSLLSNFVLFAIETSDINSKFLQKKMEFKAKSKNREKNYDIPSQDKHSSVLSSPKIQERLYPQEEDLSKSIVLTPLLSNDQIRGVAIDLRLGNRFIITRRTKFSVLDPKKHDELKARIKEYQEIVYIPYGEPFYLHPQEFVLGTTLEYISLPNDIMAYVIGRSSWGRLGLIIATATKVAPNYKGILTLELTNVGISPIVLYPGVRIAQLVLHQVSPPESKDKEQKYVYPVIAEFSKIYEDDEIKYDLLWDLKKEKLGNRLRR